MEDRRSKIGIYDGNYNPFVANLIKRNTFCLDIGCWTGNLGGELIKDKGCTVDGVDNNYNALKVATRNGYRNVYNIDLNSPKGTSCIEKIDYTYDYVVCADVIEHLINPKLVLETLGKKLDVNGVLIISVPNVAFIQSRLALMLGRFDYNPNGGLMDATHLRFFTKRTLIKTMTDAGLDADFVKGYVLVKPKYSFLKFLSSIAPTLFSLQWLATAKPTHHE